MLVSKGWIGTRGKEEAGGSGGGGGGSGEGRSLSLSLLSLSLSPPSAPAGGRRKGPMREWADPGKARTSYPYDSVSTAGAGTGERERAPAGRPAAPLPRRRFSSLFPLSMSSFCDRMNVRARAFETGPRFNRGCVLALYLSGQGRGARRDAGARREGLAVDEHGDCCGVLCFSPFCFLSVGGALCTCVGRVRGR